VKPLPSQQCITGEDQVVKVWDLASGTLLKDLHGHTDFVYSLAFSNDSSLLASGQSPCSTREHFLHTCVLCRVGPIAVTRSEDQFVTIKFYDNSYHGQKFQYLLFMHAQSAHGLVSTK